MSEERTAKRPPRARHRCQNAAAPFRLMLAVAGLSLACLVAARAGDILRGGASNASARRNIDARNAAGAAQAAARAAIAKDRLARTTRAIEALSGAQAAARAAASGARDVSAAANVYFPGVTLPTVPDGLAPGGLEVATGPNARWTGASLPAQSGNIVTIKQNQSQALLNWKTFNVGEKTTVNFDQTLGGSDIGKWTAFNFVLDPSGAPSQILGKINAGGQVYVMNQNGIIFGGASQVNTRTLVASSLPINENLVNRGILNQNKGNAEFLFSNTPQNGFAPPPPLTASGRIGDVVVLPGARLSTSVTAEGSGGRVTLVGPNVHQGGSISTPSGQTILAAGLQVGFSAHSSTDPSLRGLDVFIGDVGTYGGTARNSGLISIPTGSLIIAGKRVEQLGAVDSLTTVTLNGRIDLLASYDSLPTASFDPAVLGGIDPFLPRTTGDVIIGAGSVMRILPDYSSSAKTVGKALPLKSQVNIQGKNILFGSGSILLAPNADISIRAGNWGAVNLSAGSDDTPRAERASQSFVFTGGRVYLEAGAILDASGSPDVRVPLSGSILKVQLRGSELAVAPLQRSGKIRGVDLTIDIRRTGTYNGRYWVGTPLGDAAGFADIIEKDAAQLTAQAGSILIQAGQSVVAQPGSVIDVSGGFFRNEGGRVQTSRLLYQGRYIIDIAQATPDRAYDGVFTARFTKTQDKWGVSNTWNSPLAPLGAYNQQEYIAGADGGTLNIASPGMVLDGELLGKTIIGPRQLRKSEGVSELPQPSSLNLTFEAQKEVVAGATQYYAVSPTPPRVVFGSTTRGPLAPPFDTSNSQPVPPERLSEFSLPPDFFKQTGFGVVSIKNDDGEFLLPAGLEIELPAYSSLSATGRRIDLLGSLRAPSGQLAFKAFNLSPYQIPLDQLGNPLLPQPVADPSKGVVHLGQSTRLDVSGLVVDDRRTAPLELDPQPFATSGGSISLSGYSVFIPRGSVLDASGGVGITARGKYKYGNAGSISIAAGNDLNYPSVLGGKLQLLGQLLGYAGRGARGGTLSIKAPLIQIGGAPLHPDTLLLAPDFFSRGGFQTFNLTGIGARDPNGGPTPSDPEAPAAFIPAVYVAPGTVIEPRVESLAYVPFPEGGQGHLRRIVRPMSERPPVSISFSSSTIRNTFYDPASLEGAGRLVVVRGDILIAESARIQTEPGGTIAARGATVTVLGSLIAPGGSITLSGANSFPLDSIAADLASNALATVYLGPRARLSTAGAAVYAPDPFGRRVGRLYDGGRISVSGNIVAEAGAILDVSGSSAVFDYHPSQLGIGLQNAVPLNSGVNSLPYSRRTAAYRADGDGGTITLAGSQMLYSDATLLGRAGGPTAVGGTLQVSSGRFYVLNQARSTADINMVVSQSGQALFGGRPRGIGRPVRDAADLIRPGDGYFAVDRFTSGGFDSLDLNYYYDESAQFVPQAGNIFFSGNVEINARGFLRVAGGGVIQGDGNIVLNAPYIALGQAFAPPLNPSETYLPYRRFDPGTGQTPQDFVAPTSGSGRLSVNAGLLDLGTVVLKSIGRAALAARGGDIRGSGTFNIRGDLTLEAAQIYPVTLGNFDLFAYDPPGGKGSITVRKSGRAAAPLSAAGTLRLFASMIDQGGVLVAPFGSIVLGWDGTDQNLSTPAVDPPVNRVAGTALPAPVASEVLLRSGSVTSVAGIDFESGAELLIPYGFSPDGISVFDPRGVNFTAAGLPEKSVTVAGNAVRMEGGAVIDIRGAGDLFSYRWVSGPGGLIDLLSEPSSEWLISGTYSAGDLVRYQGRTYSANVGINPATFPFSQGPAPGVTRYWSEVAQSYAILPGFGSKFAPYAPFNASSFASALGGDPGLISYGLQIGDQVYLDRGSGLPAGAYTLLPRGYARLPGAFLITPQSRGPYGLYTIPEGSTFLTGYRFNHFNRPRQFSAIRDRFEIAPPEVVAGRVTYDTFGLSEFLADAASRLDLPEAQRLPRDSGYLLFSGNTAMSLQGTVLSKPLSKPGRGSMIDIASFANIEIVGSGQSGSGSVVLNAGILNSFGAESLVIGGVRRKRSDGNYDIEVRTQGITLDNNGSPLVGSDILLASRRSLTLAPGSRLLVSGARTEPAKTYFFSGDGVAARVSADSSAQIFRSNITSSNLPLLTIGAGAQIAGAGVTLDSSYGFALDPSAAISAEELNFGAGQIAVVLSPTAIFPGQIVTPQLVLEGSLLDQLKSIRRLSLVAYQNTIDIYGPGSFGESLGGLSMQAGEIRGFNQGGGSSTFRATEVEISNPRNIAAPGPVNVPAGELVFNADTIQVGGGNSTISQFGNVIMNADGVIFSGIGSLSAQQDITVNTPLVVAASGSRQNLLAGGALQLNKTAASPKITPGIGGLLFMQGTSVLATSDVILPSGLIEIQSTGAGGDVTIGGLLDTRGQAVEFYDVTRYTDGGEIRITSRFGDVTLLAGSDISVAANAGGGNAGFVTINAPLGQFTALGKFDGQAGAGGRGGEFKLDAGSLASFDTLRVLLNDGGFTESRDIRVRTGDIVVSGSTIARNFTLSVDAGSITVQNSGDPLLPTIDASGVTGGSIRLIARNNLTVESGAWLDASGLRFSNAGKGGHIYLEAGASSGGTAGPGVIDIQAGALLDLSVAAYQQGATLFPNGDWQDPTSSAFLGQFQGTLHLRAPQIGGNTDVAVNKIFGTITGASSVLVEGYRIYTPAGGVMNIALRNLINTEAAGFINPNEAAMRSKLFGATVNSALDPILVIAPGAEVVNLAGDLTLGLANPTGSTNVEARSTADWNLAAFRYGTRLAPGVLTLRATGDLVFNNTLSDGFAAVANTSANGNSVMWLGTPLPINTLLPVNTQSWSYRITAGSDTAAVDAARVLPSHLLAPDKGSVLVGEFYPAVPNTSSSGSAAAIGASGLTANTIRISTSATDLGTRYEVVRTGTGDISVNAGRDVQLRNQFATIYTAGVAIPNSERTRIFQPNDFVLPLVTQTGLAHPNQGVLGAIQQVYAPYYTMSGGDVRIAAGGDIGRFTLYNSAVIPDTSRQLPTSWLYRRGYVDPSGVFGVGGVGTGGLGTVVDPAASTTWWVDFSNFFQGFGALGGGDVSLRAGRDLVNADALVPTNARMAGRDPVLAVNIAPDGANLLEYGGGDIVAIAGRDISGGSYYVEKGEGRIFAGGEITTNSAKTISRGILAGATPEIRDPDTWVPTLFYVGRSGFDIAARSNALVGPVINPFLLPQGLNNKFWYKTQFNTYSPDASATFRSFGGAVTHRLSVNLPGSSEATPVIYAMIENMNLISPVSPASSQPWIRLAERTVVGYRTMLSVQAPSISTTAFSGDINVAGVMNLYPSPSGALNLLAKGAFVGMQRTGRITVTVDGAPTQVNSFASAIINLSDADPARLPGIISPLAFQSLVGNNPATVRDSLVDPLGTVSPSFQETGSFSGVNASAVRQQALHASSILHAGDPEPLRIYAAGGSISNLTLFSPKASRIVAFKDITDIAFYLQNAEPNSVSLVSAGRDIIPFNENAPLRVAASNLGSFNYVVDPVQETVTGTLTRALAGDIQIGGPGTLEVLAGRNIDLGTGPNFLDGRGTGITSIGRSRNPFLPVEGSRLVVLAGVRGRDDGPALGLEGSDLDFEQFIQAYLPNGVASVEGLSPETEELLKQWSTLSKEEQNIAALEVFFAILRQSASEAAETGSYATGTAAAEMLFGKGSAVSGEIFTRARDIRTASGGGIIIATPKGGITMASDIFGNPLTPPGIVTALGGAVSIFMEGSLDIGAARVFTLRGGDITIWSSTGDIAAGTAAKTVVTAPPTRVLIDSNTGEVVTDLGGLATGGGIGVLASVAGVEPGSVSLIAPQGTIDAGDAGIRATGDITIAATTVLNADNIAASGSSVGVPSAPVAAAPNVSGLSSGASAAAASSAAAQSTTEQARQEAPPADSTPSVITVEVLGYGGGAGGEEGEEDRLDSDAGTGSPAASPSDPGSFSEP